MMVTRYKDGNLNAVKTGLKNPNKRGNRLIFSIV